MYVRTGVLVTNLGVHFKLGRENSVVWVTTLDRGKPVEGAEVAVNDCNGKPLWTGRTDAKGLARRRPRARRRTRATCVADSGYFVTRAQGRRRTAGAADVAFVFSSWQKGIESWRFNVPTGRGAEPDAARRDGVRPHPAARRRDGVDEALRPRSRPRPASRRCRPSELPTRVKIVHQGSGQEFVQPLQWNGDSAARVDAWNIPPAAKLGVYEVVARARDAAATAASDAAPRAAGPSGNFRVEEFRLPLVDARVSGPKARAGRAARACRSTCS